MRMVRVIKTRNKGRTEFFGINVKGSSTAPGWGRSGSLSSEVVYPRLFDGDYMSGSIRSYRRLPTP